MVEGKKVLLRTCICKFTNKSMETFPLLFPIVLRTGIMTLL